MTDIPTMKRRIYEALFEPDGLTLRDAAELHLDLLEALAELEHLRRERDAACNAVDDEEQEQEEEDPSSSWRFCEGCGCRKQTARYRSFSDHAYCNDCTSRD